MAHDGFDGLRLISDMWRGALVGRTIRVRFERTARAAILDRAGTRAGGDAVPSVPA